MAITLATDTSQSTTNTRLYDAELHVMAEITAAMNTLNAEQQRRVASWISERWRWGGGKRVD